MSRGGAGGDRPKRPGAVIRSGWLPENRRVGALSPRKAHRRARPQAKTPMNRRKSPLRRRAAPFRVSEIAIGRGGANSMPPQYSSANSASLKRAHRNRDNCLRRTEQPRHGPRKPVQDQYFGDINDYRKYGLLRCICEAELHVGVCWMKTPSDNSGQGGRTDYLAKPHKYRSLDRSRAL